MYASIGIAHLPDNQVSDGAALVELADQRMCLAKQVGRNRLAGR